MRERERETERERVRERERERERESGGVLEEADAIRPGGVASQCFVNTRRFLRQGAASGLSLLVSPLHSDVLLINRKPARQAS